VERVPGDSNGSHGRVKQKAEGQPTVSSDR